MERSRGDTTELPRAVGGMLLATGAVVTLIRESGHHGWSDFARVLIVLIPALTLYLLALQQPTRRDADAGRPSSPVLAVAAILLWPVVLLEILQWLGASTHHVLYTAAVFALTALFAGYAARRARVPYAALLAGLALVVTWLLVWSKILDNPGASAYRWLLVAVAAVLLTLAARLWRAEGIGAGEIAVAGGIAAVAAGVLGVIVGTFVGAFRGVATMIGPTVDTGHLLQHTSGLQSFGWDAYLLIVSLALVCGGARARIRGLGYVGATGLLAFIISTGAQITRIESGRSPAHGLAGWPWVLLLLGIIGLIAPLMSYRDAP